MSAPTPDQHGTEGGAQDGAARRRLDAIALAHTRLRAAAADLSEAEVRTAIHLPGWTRGHVLIHLADLAQAFARQASYTRKGERIEVYDGGRPTRDRRIEELHDRPADWLRDRLDEGLTALEEAWAALDAQDWERPCAYRDSPLLATQLAWWRESALHEIDLGLGRTTEELSDELSLHLVEFLRVRLPDGVRTAVAPDAIRGEATAETGSDTDADAGAVIRGTAQSLAGWLSGRPVAVLPTAGTTAAAAGGLPELKGWP
ncbi:maleylpyruvate isomerase family mycothiol-dependent enzyme [Streptomyces sp. NPDC051546]|uniref:maleylpyruvate isomerase family mycothiol-dependent enzyme n=1 Tax=Streptomyces sp. NPDC051546 TaxID=3365655 RepID=UPI0037917DCC